MACLTVKWRRSSRFRKDLGVSVAAFTIKAQSVTLDYKASDSETYQLNFINFQAIDFSYEVSRSLAACEGCIAGGRRRAGR